MKKKTLGIYQSHMSEIGGVETFLYNFCWWIRNYFDVTVVYGSANAKQLERLRRIVKIENYNEKEKFEFDIVLRNSVWGEVCTKIYSRENRYIEMRHANYKYLIEEGLLYQQYHTWDRTNEIVGCGEFVSKMSHEALGDNPTTIKNILLPIQETHKVLRLISCTRLDPAKGWNRMLKMMDMMREAGIKFEWNIFTNSTYRCDYEEVHFWKQRYDIWDYLASADYTVLLSDSEGLPYTVQESLQYKVPCIVTDVGGCTELIKDGVNGYVVPLDMNFDINRIKKIPKCSEYDNHALEDWLKYLEYDGKIIDKELLIKDFKEEIEMKVKVKAIINFNDLEDNVQRKTGDVFECAKERADFLLEHKAIEIIEEVKEEKKYSFVIAEKLDDENITPLSTKEELDKLGDKIKEYVVTQPKSTKKKKSSKK